MKCIVIETSPERTNAHPVTNEDGSAHIYATMKEARAELRANGYSYNRENQRYYIQGTEYRAYIIREDSDEYAKIIEQDEPENRTADAAAASFCAAYEDATGEPPYYEEAVSVCKVAREDIAGQPIATAEDRETVAAMVDAIAEQAETAADARAEWSGEGLYRIAWSDGGQKSDPHHYETAEELAADLTSAYQHATETHQPYAERLEYYERAELLAYLGEPSDFDVEAIEAEATDTDEHGSRYWTADAEELAAIAQRNQN